jgi:hypothetical protein
MILILFKAKIVLSVIGFDSVFINYCFYGNLLISWNDNFARELNIIEIQCV